MKKLFTLITLMLANVMLALAGGPSGTLPVIYINIDNGAEVTSKETYLKADYWLDPKGADGIEAIGSANSPLRMQIKGRGNWTFVGFDKKPYRLKLDKKQPLLGLDSSKHFGLLAHADDFRGFLRNTIGFEVAKGVGLPWTPEQRPIEVMVNGSYRGLYFLVELIRIDKKRVNITEWGEEDADGNELSQWIEGGTLVEIDNYDEEGQIQFIDGDGEIMRVTYDKSVDPGYEPDGYRDWLRNQFETMNSLIFGNKNSDEIWNYIDIDDCARFMLVQDITNNYESFHGSCYLHREKGQDEKWHFSPVWDFGSAFYNDNFPYRHFWEGSVHHNHWAAQLWQFPKLQEKMKEYWHKYCREGFNQLLPFAREFLDNISSAAAADKERWPQYGNDNLNDKYNYLTRFLADSKNFMTQLYGEPQNEDPDDETFVVPEDEFGVYHVFFKPTGDNVAWDNVKIFWWHAGLFNAPEWPGVDCKKVKVSGQDYWHYKLRASEEKDDYMLIFGNGGSEKGKTQTYDLKVRKRGVYTIDMPNHSEPAEYLAVGAGPTEVKDLLEESESNLRIIPSSGGLVIDCNATGTLHIYSIDGTVRVINVVVGTQSVSLPKGVYIIDGKKYAVK